MEKTKQHGNTKYPFGEMVIGEKKKIACNPYSMKTALNTYNKKHETSIEVDYRVTDRGMCEVWRVK